MTAGNANWYMWHGHVVQIVDRAPSDDSEVVVTVVKSAVSPTVGLTLVVPIEQLASIAENIAAGQAD